MLYISKSKLYSISKNEFGMGISDYIRILRIEKAKKLLLNGEERIYDIAAKVGYEDSNYFTRAFKSETGMTPKKYREAKRS
jgi:two-component system response regulator YesN